ncbi:hypothetical protein FRUB_06318 [Fimbriiglobus ruber]|uniref:Glycine zipper domain-containing protein n=2 Tax=Fimbriiglobus ruber TaxID=1908690 RepID=A0A225DBT9_9BACT|nr:hypothetical protein FRUB_06318 [Fimbriiglobus ruber]
MALPVDQVRGDQVVLVNYQAPQPPERKSLVQHFFETVSENIGAIVGGATGGAVGLLVGGPGGAVAGGVGGAAAGQAFFKYLFQSDPPGKPTIGK